MKEKSKSYLKIDKEAYAASFKKAKGDKDLLAIAEEGLTDSLEQLMVYDQTN